MAALIQSYSETNVDTDNGDMKAVDPSASVDNSRQGLAFAIPASPTYTLTSFKLYLKKVGSPTGTARASLYAATGTIESATPTGSELAGVNFDISTLTTSYALYEFTLGTPYLSTPSTTYCAFLQNPGSGVSNVNYAVVGMKESGSGNGINQVRFTNGSWTANTRAPAYYLYGTAAATSGAGLLLNFL